MIRFQHKRQQWPVGHGFFHSASIEVNGDIYRYVYDCGAVGKPTINKQVDRYFKNEELEDLPSVLDMVVISHFHTDHVKGIPYLFTKFEVKRLVLPYLDDDFKLVALAHLAASGPTVWRQLSGLVIDSTAWVRAQGQETEIIEVSDEGGEIFDVAPVPANGNGFSLGRGRVDHSSPAAIYCQSDPFWIFKFYIGKSPAISSAVIGGLVSKFGGTKQDLKKKLRSLSWIRKNWAAVADVFKSLGSSKQNATTLCMYSGPENLEHIERFTSTLSSSPWMWDFHFYRQQRVGWLGTGDAELKPPSKFSHFQKHFNHLLQQVDTVAIPHHGSRENYNAKLGDIGWHHIITSDHIEDPKDCHPAAEVMLNLRTKSHSAHVVSLLDSAAVYDRINGVLDV